MSQEDTEAIDVTRLPLKALGLRTGMALQTRRLVEGASKKESQYFGAIEGKGVMVGPLSSDATQTGLSEGEVCVVRGFTGLYEYSFLSKVLQTFEKPFVYALLAYPAQVDARKVRQSMRTKVSWPTEVSSKADGAFAAKPVELVDLSVAGAMVRADSNLGTLGQLIDITLHAEMDGAPIAATLTAKICHNNKVVGEDFYCIGLAFQNPGVQEKMTLHFMTQVPPL